MLSIRAKQLCKIIMIIRICHQSLPLSKYLIESFCLPPFQLLDWAVPAFKMASVGIPDPVDEGSVSSPLSATCHKKSWEELRHAVRKSRKHAASLLNRVPHSFTFRTVLTPTGPQIRLYFLGVPVGSRENTLLYTDLLNEPKMQLPGEAGIQLEWKTLLESFHATPLYGKFSRVEQLLRERKRLGSFGITSYDYNEETGTFVFPACNSLFLCADTVKEDGFVVSFICFSDRKHLQEHQWANERDSSITDDCYITCTSSCCCCHMTVMCDIVML